MVLIRPQAGASVNSIERIDTSLYPLCCLCTHSLNWALTIGFRASTVSRILCEMQEGFNVCHHPRIASRTMSRIDGQVYIPAQVQYFRHSPSTPIRLSSEEIQSYNQLTAATVNVSPPTASHILLPGDSSPL